MSSRAKRKRLNASHGSAGLSLNGTLTINAQAGEDGTPKTPTFCLSAYNGGAMRVDGWRYPVVVDSAGVKSVAASIPVYLSHVKEPENLLGQTSSMDVDGSGKIVASGSFTASRETSPRYAAMLDHAGNGYKWQVSMGAGVGRNEFVAAGKTVEVNGQTFAGPINVARSVSMNHIAIVPLGADTTTSATIAAQSGQESIMNFEQWLIAQGKDASKLSDDEKDRLQAAYDAMAAAGVITASNTGVVPQPKTDNPDATIQASNAAHAANMRRIAAIDQLQAAYGSVKEIEADGKKLTVGEFCASAIEAGTAASDVELSLLRASRAPSRSGLPAIHAHHGIESAGDKVIEAALVLKHNVIPDDKALVASYGEQTLDAANKFRGVRLSKMIEIICGQHGVQLPLTVDDQYIRAAFSTASLSGVLGNVANKAMGASFMSVNQVAPRISRARSHMNFHAHTIYSMALNGDLQEVGPRGELKHLNLSQDSYTRQVKTRGALLGLSRADLINDELGAFLDTAQRMGRKAALSRERVTFKAINGTGNGASFFTSGNKNYISGANTALSYAALGKGVQTMRDQVGLDGDPIGVEPRILLVPTALEVTAKELTNPNSTLIATALGSTSAAKREPQANIWAGSFRPEVSEWLSKTIDGVSGSSAAWYLLADPADVPAIEISYLNGAQQPTIEYFGLSTDPNVLGVTWQCFWDFGVDLAEYRAGVKSKGSA